MRKTLKTASVAVLTVLMLVTGSSMSYAQKTSVKTQKSLVTPSMAKKVAFLVQNNQGMLRSIFYSANEIRSIRKADAILYSINEHPDYVERFLVEILSIYGTGDSGYIVLTDCGFTIP